MWAMIEKFRSRSWGMVTGGECSRAALGGDSGHPFLTRAYVGAEIGAVHISPHGAGDSPGHVAHDAVASQESADVWSGGAQLAGIGRRVPETEPDTAGVSGDARMARTDGSAVDPGSEARLESVD